MPMTHAEKPARRRLTPEEEQVGAELFSEGASERDVAEALECSPSTAHRLHERVQARGEAARAATAPAATADVVFLDGTAELAGAQDGEDTVKAAEKAALRRYLSRARARPFQCEVLTAEDVPFLADDPRVILREVSVTAEIQSIEVITVACAIAQSGDGLPAAEDLVAYRDGLLRQVADVEEVMSYLRELKEAGDLLEAAARLSPGIPSLLEPYRRYTGELEARRETLREVIIRRSPLL